MISLLRLLGLFLVLTLILIVLTTVIVAQCISIGNIKISISAVIVPNLFEEFALGSDGLLYRFVPSYSVCACAIFVESS